MTGPEGIKRLILFPKNLSVRLGNIAIRGTHNISRFSAGPVIKCLVIYHNVNIIKRSSVSIRAQVTEQGYPLTLLIYRLLAGNSFAVSYNVTLK